MGQGVLAPVSAVRGLLVEKPSIWHDGSVPGHLRCGAMTLTTTEDSSSPGPGPVLCDFCGRSSAEAGPMIEGRALVPTGMGRPIAHVCAHCVRVAEGLF